MSSPSETFCLLSLRAAVRSFNSLLFLFPSFLLLSSSFTRLPLCLSSLSLRRLVRLCYVTLKRQAAAKWKIRRNKTHPRKTVDWASILDRCEFDFLGFGGTGSPVSLRHVRCLLFTRPESFLSAYSLHLFSVFWTIVPINCGVLRPQEHETWCKTELLAAACCCKPADEQELLLNYSNTEGNFNVRLFSGAVSTACFVIFEGLYCYDQRFPQQVRGRPVRRYKERGFESKWQLSAYWWEGGRGGAAGGAALTPWNSKKYHIQLSAIIL